MLIFGTIQTFQSILKKGDLHIFMDLIKHRQVYKASLICFSDISFSFSRFHGKEFWIF